MTLNRMREVYLQLPDVGKIQGNYNDKFMSFVNDDVNTSCAIAQATSRTPISAKRAAGARASPSGVC